MAEQTVQDLQKQVQAAQNRAREAETGARDAADKAKVRLWVSVIVVAIVAFVIGLWPIGGWVNGSTAEKMANDAAQLAQQELAVAVLTPVCVANAQADPDGSLLVTISAAQPAQQINEVLKTTWVTFDENVNISTATKRVVAEACLKGLSPSEEAAKTDAG